MGYLLHSSYPQIHPCKDLYQVIKYTKLYWICSQWYKQLCWIYTLGLINILRQEDLNYRFCKFSIEYLYFSSNLQPQENRCPWNYSWQAVLQKGLQKKHTGLFCTVLLRVVQNCSIQCGKCALVLYLFSCPEQLNRWPCHSITHWVSEWPFAFGT